jgi:hypothetical protein
MGSTTIAWSIKKQPTTSLSTREAGYKAKATTSCEVAWLRRILEELHEQQEQPTQLICDNQSVIQMTKNPVFHKKTKHIDIQYSFFRDLVQLGMIKIMYCIREDQVAYIFTKTNSEMILEYFQMIIMGRNVVILIRLKIF